LKIFVVDKSNANIFTQNAALISRVFEKINGIEVIHIDDKNTGLSKARNLGLTYIADQGYLCSPIECSHYRNAIKISDPYVFHPVIRGGQADYEKAALASSYVNLHPELGLFFKVFFLLSIFRTAIKSCCSEKDKLLLKGKIRALQSQTANKCTSKR